MSARLGVLVVRLPRLGVDARIGYRFVAGRPSYRGDQFELPCVEIESTVSASDGAPLELTETELDEVWDLIVDREEGRA